MGRIERKWIRKNEKTVNNEKLKAEKEKCETWIKDWRKKQKTGTRKMKNSNRIVYVIITDKLQARNVKVTPLSSPFSVTRRQFIFLL